MTVGNVAGEDFFGVEVEVELLLSAPPLRVFVSVSKRPILLLLLCFVLLACCVSWFFFLSLLLLLFLLVLLVLLGAVNLTGHSTPRPPVCCLDYLTFCCCS